MWSRWSVLAFLLTVLVTLLCIRFYPAIAEEKNVFDLSSAVIPVELVLSGGPDKDGIPSIDQPKFESAKTVNWLANNEQLLSLTIGSETRGYPLSILNWHEVVNDRFQERSVVISYCPLCGTGMAFSSTVKNQDLQFGVSGLLYNSDVLLYDRESMSLWSQIMGQAISGPLVSEKLHLLPLKQVSWKVWKQENPNGQVLSRNTGFRRDYSKNPYEGYEKDGELYFPITFRSHKYHPKQRVLGVEIGGEFKAYPFVELAKLGGNKVSDIFQGKSIQIEYDSEANTGLVRDKSTGEVLPSVNAFWFAWYTFHPEGDVFTFTGDAQR